MDGILRETQIGLWVKLLLLWNQIHGAKNEDAKFLILCQ